MKANSNTSRIQRAANLLLIAEVGCATVTIAMVVLLFVGKIGDIGLVGQLDLSPLHRQLPASASELAQVRAVAAKVEMPSTVASVVVLSDPSSATLSVLRGPRIVTMLWHGLFQLAVLDLLRRLCRALARGEIFTADNLERLRWLGIVFIVDFPVRAVLDGWWGKVCLEFVREKLTVVGQSFVPPPLGAPGRFPIGALTLDFRLDALLCVGLALIIASHVLKEGLALKTENDLTV